MRNLKFEADNADLLSILFNKEDTKEEVISYRQSVQTVQVGNF